MGRTSDARERLIEEASRLFHARSYEGVGVQELCDAAEINKGSFYHFFKSKDELAAAVIDAYWVTIRDELLVPTLAADIAPLARIERFFEQLTREQRTRPSRDRHHARLSAREPDRRAVRPRAQAAPQARHACSTACATRSRRRCATPSPRASCRAARTSRAPRRRWWRSPKARTCSPPRYDDPALVGRTGRLALGLIGAKPT